MEIIKLVSAYVVVDVTVVFSRAKEDHVPLLFGSKTLKAS
jgi:hypothetical protein